MEKKKISAWLRRCEKKDLFDANEDLRPHSTVFLWCFQEKKFVGIRNIVGDEDRDLSREICMEFLYGHYYVLCRSTDDRKSFNFKLSMRNADEWDLFYDPNRFAKTGKMYWVLKGDELEGPHFVPEGLDHDKLHRLQRGVSGKILFVVDSSQNFEPIYFKHAS